METVFEFAGVGTDNELWHTIRYGDGTWQQRMGSVAGQSGGGPSGGFTAAGSAQVVDDVQLVGVGADGTLWHTIRFSNGSWWPSMGSIESQSSGGPANGFVTVSCAGLGDDLFVFGVGSDGQLWFTIRYGDGSWEPAFDTVESQVAGGPNGGFIGVGAATVGTDLEVVGVGSDHQLWHTLLGSGGWVPQFGLVESQSSGGPSGGFTAVACGGVGTELQVVGLGADGQLWHTIRESSGSWQPSFGLVESQSSGGPSGFTAVGCAGVGPELQVTGVGTDGQPWHTIRSATGWTPSFGDIASQSANGPSGYRALAGSSGSDAAATWLLGFTSTDPSAPAGGGRPWGDGTAMAARAAQGALPFDVGSQVTPMVGGYLAMDAFRDTFEAAISDAEAQAANGVPPGSRGHVYIADWQFNALRDLSTTNPWGGNPWNPSTSVTEDQTALGFVLRMMSAGIVVRMLLWMPTTTQATTMKNLAAEHWSVAAAVQDANNALQKQWGISQPIGVVALDLRTASPLSASLHQKMIAVRVGAVNTAFCGGVDLAFTRRDFGLEGTQAIGIGDWQSGSTIPIPSQGWPKQSPPPASGYPSFPSWNTGQFTEDLPANVYGSGNRHWHDHHLQLHGPIVASIEQQFAERWIIDTGGRVYVFSRGSVIGNDNQVQLTSPAAISGGKVMPLPSAAAVANAGTTTVQMWRTIPLRPNVAAPPFVRGEFTIMAGVANAVSQASSLITIWDQYFWSEPLARLLAAQLMANPGLRLLIVLPPYGTTQPSSELWLRKQALQDLWNGLDANGRSRVLARDMWASGPNVGVYVHAKAQTYDDQLLVCGSGNMNRRSLECDAELDCAVLDTSVVEAHLAALYATLTGNAWSDFDAGWLERYWTAIGSNSSRALIADPFFVANPGTPSTPNGVSMPTSAPFIYSIYEPTSIGPPVESSVCGFPQCPGDPKAPGRLDEVTFLLERCYSGNSWPWRVANTSSVAFADEDLAEPELMLPRLTL